MTAALLADDWKLCGWGVRKTKCLQYKSQQNGHNTFYSQWFRRTMARKNHFFSLDITWLKNKKHDMLFMPGAWWPHLAYSWLCGAACRLDSLKCHRMRHGLEVTEGMEKSLEEVKAWGYNSASDNQLWFITILAVYHNESGFPFLTPAWPRLSVFFHWENLFQLCKIKFTSEGMSLPVYNSWELQTISPVFFKPANKERRRWDLTS